MKTQEELNALKEEFETLNKKLAELSEDELVQVSGAYNPHDEHIMGGALNLGIGGLENIGPATFYGNAQPSADFGGCPGLKPGSGLPAKPTKPDDQFT